MAQALHEVDEETDVGAYQAYLRAQTDSDLYDIAQHINAEGYPARADAAQRELRRRRVLRTPIYTPKEYAIRYAALFAFGLAFITLPLTLLLTPQDVAGPAWPTVIPDGVTTLQVIRLFVTATLREMIVWSVHLGLYGMTLTALAYWTLSRGIALLRHRARTDVWRLVALATMTLVIVIGSAVAPGSSIPDLFSAGDGQRAFTLLNPFG